MQRVFSFRNGMGNPSPALKPDQKPGPATPTQGCKMKMNLTKTVAAGAVSIAALIAGGGAAFAECAIQGAGSVRILSNDFEALRVGNDAAATCATDTVAITANATAEHKNIQGPALTANPAEYTVAVVANNSIVPLLNDGLIRPLDDLVAQYGAWHQPRNSGSPSRCRNLAGGWLYPRPGGCWRDRQCDGRSQGLSDAALYGPAAYRPVGRACGLYRWQGRRGSGAERRESGL